MKAGFIERFGGPDVLTCDWPDPVAEAGEVVIDLVAASVNGADWKVRSSHLAASREHSACTTALALAVPQALSLK